VRLTIESLVVLLLLLFLDDGISLGLSFNRDVPRFHIKRKSLVLVLSCTIDRGYVVTSNFNRRHNSVGLVLENLARSNGLTFVSESKSAELRNRFEFLDCDRVFGGYSDFASCE